MATLGLARRWPPTDTSDAEGLEDDRFIKHSTGKSSPLWFTTLSIFFIACRWKRRINDYDQQLTSLSKVDPAVHVKDLEFQCERAAPTDSAGAVQQS